MLSVLRLQKRAAAAAMYFVRVVRPGKRVASSTHVRMCCVAGRSSSAWPVVAAYEAQLPPPHVCSVSHLPFQCWLYIYSCERPLRGCVDLYIARWAWLKLSRSLLIGV